MEKRRDYFENISKILEKGLKINDKTEESLREDIEIVRNWVKNQPHLPEVPNDHVITSFLIMNKFSIENVKQKIDMYYTMRSLYPQYFNKHPLSPVIQQAMRNFCFIPLPKSTEEGYRVIIFRGYDENFDFDLTDYFALTYSVTEVRMQEDYNVGDIMVYDMKHMTLAHVAQFTPTQMKNYSTILEKAFNSNIKQIHILNYHPYMEPIISLAKKLLNQKIAQRFHFHDSIDSMVKFIPLNILPKNYGGDGLSLKEYSDIWTQKFEDYKERFDILEKLRVNEELRPTPLINDDVLGYYGNFKKVNVD